MPQIKDDLGREFVSLPVLSSILNLSAKQVRRHVRDKRMLSVKRGQRRYVFKDDILREYPTLSPEALNRDIRDILADKRDTIGTSPMENGVLNVPNVLDVPLEKEIDLYRQDQKTDMVLTKIEQVKTVITRLEKSISDIGYIQQDTKTLDRKMDRIHNKMSLLEEQKGHKGHNWFIGGLFVLILGIAGAGIYGVYQFNLLYKETQSNYAGQLTSKDREITRTLEKHTGTVKHYEKEIGANNLEAEKLKVKLAQQQQEITQLQETITAREQAEQLKK